MPPEQSPLRDRVVFVEGAPRSGTTLLTALLATHPGVAGITAESHLFDRGVGTLLENHEQTEPFKSALIAYLSREELVALTRELCDGVLLAMRARVNPEAQLVLEKTPAPRSDAAKVLARKLELYPDAAYVHIVREAGAVARSLLRAPFKWDRSRRGAIAYRDEAVSSIRSVLGHATRYQEVSYEALVESPAETIAELFAWLGLDPNEETMRRVSLRAEERFADLAPVQLAGPTGGSDGERRWRSIANRLAAVLRQRIAQRDAPAAAAGGGIAVAGKFAPAFRERDRSAIVELTTEDFTFAVLSGAGDRRADGPDARALLHQVAERIFTRPLQSESWSVHDGGDAAIVLFSAHRADGYRLDFSLSLAVRGARVAKATLLSAGDLGGRPLQMLEL